MSQPQVVATALVRLVVISPARATRPIPLGQPGGSASARRAGPPRPCLRGGPASIQTVRPDHGRPRSRATVRIGEAAPPHRPVSDPDGDGSARLPLSVHLHAAGVEARVHERIVRDTDRRAHHISAGAGVHIPAPTEVPTRPRAW
jgi:hypothetical protein